MSEILRRLSWCLILVFSTMVFTVSAQSAGKINLFDNKAIFPKTSSNETYRKAPYVKKRVTVRRVTKQPRKRYRAGVKPNRIQKVRRYYPVRKKRYIRKATPVRKRIVRKRYVRKTRIKRVRKRYARQTYVHRKRRAPRVTGRSVRYSASGRSRYSSLIAKHANRYGVPVNLAHAVVRIESNYRAGVRGGAGEVGLMQIKPSTARSLGFRGSVRALYNPDTNLKYGMKYLAGAYRLSGGSICGTVLRYNAGHGAKRMNPISARYCRKAKRILGRRHRYGSGI